jgi:hypothetical protein
MRGGTFLSTVGIENIQISVLRKTYIVSAYLIGNSFI